jgi:hypothetical protein
MGEDVGWLFDRSPGSGVGGHGCSWARGAVTGGGRSALPSGVAGVGPYLDPAPRWGVSSKVGGLIVQLVAFETNGEERVAGSQPVGSRVVEELCGTCRPGWRGSRACCRRPRRWRLDQGRHTGRYVCRRDETSLSSTSRHARLRHRVSSRLDEVLTCTTRAAPPDPGRTDYHQATDLAVGGSNPSRRATITAAQRPRSKVADSCRGAGLRPHWRALQPDCDHLRPQSPVPAAFLVISATVAAPVSSRL